MVGEKLALATVHFLRQWVPLLGQTAALVVLELRGEVLAGGSSEATRRGHARFRPRS